MDDQDDIEITGGELQTIPNDKYRKFFAKFDEIIALDVSQWKKTHLIGYFCKKYKDTYKVDYAWKFNNQSPSKCFEVWQINTLSSKLSANPKILKDYIDWVYDNVVPTLKSKFRSISLLTKDETINYYKVNVLLANQGNTKIDRSTLLPQNYADVFNQASGLKIRTYGDLAFLVQETPLPDNISKAMTALANCGFNLDSIKKII